jgi:hypothetical protein
MLMTAKPDHCQGCGVKEGAPRTTWHSRTSPGGEIVRVPHGHGPARLTVIDLDGTPRALCQVCASHARRIVADIQMFGLAKPGRLEKSREKPDSRQLSF